MGFTTEQKVEETRTPKLQTNPMKSKNLKLNKSEFYSFLQELNYKTELGID